MRTILAAGALALTFLPVLALAQEPVAAFDQLNTRLKIGDRVFLTDSQGRKQAGRLVALSPSSLALDGRTFPASDVRLVEERRPDRLKNGALIGLGTGLGIGAALAASFCYQEGCDAGRIVLGVAMYGGIGAAIGAGIDALIPGKKLVVYRGPGDTASMRVRVAPIITRYAKGVALSVGF